MLNETDGAAFVEKDSTACAVTNGAYTECVSTGTDTWDQVFKTTNYREVSFRAEIDQRLTCPNGSTVILDLYGEAEFSP